MSNTIKKVAAVGLSLATVTLLSGSILVASAQSVDLNALLAQIAALQAQIAALQGGTTPAAITSASFTRDLTVGSEGDDVKALQQFLNNKGYIVSASGAGAPGNESTYFGAKTQAALAKYQAATGISPTAGYFGPKTRAIVGAALATTGTVTPGTTTGTTTGTVVTVPATGLEVSLASDNPASTSFPKGATGVAVIKFNVAGSGTLDSLTFKRQGLGATGDFGSSGFYLYEGTTRLTTGKSLNSTTHEVSFVNIGLAVSGTKTLTLVADISVTATAGDTNQFTLVSATGNPTPSGTLVGNAMGIAGATVGGVTAASGAAPTNPRVGQTAAKLAEFTLTAGATEDIEVRRIALTEGGSIANSNLTNLVLKQAGNTLATAAAVGSRDLITFELATPFVLEKGQVRTFDVYGDVSGTTRSSDTVVLYFDSAADLYAIGKLYGYPVTPTITSLDTTGEGDTLTVQGGQMTITFNGPVTGDIALRGQDVEVYNFTIAAQNNIEIRNLRFTASTTNMQSGDGFNDFKVWDTTSNAVVTSAVDVTTSSNVTFTDVVNLSAGQSRTFKVTVDVDADNDDSDTLRVDLLAFQSSDVKNLDNNTFVATTSIVPSTLVSGNTQTVKVQTLDIQLAGTPASQTVVRGTSNVSLAGFSFRAIAGDIRLAAVRVTATSSSGTITSGDVTSLGLYDGDTLVSDGLKSLDASALNATFNTNITITKGSTKVLTVKGNIDSNMTNGDQPYIYLATAGSADITAYDKDGNAATLSGTAANSGGTVVVTTADVGSVAVTTAADDVESEAGIVIAGQETVLAKFRVTATNEAMTLNKMQLLVVPTSSATATSSASADEVSVVKLYEGATPIGSSAGYSVTGSGDNSGTVFIQDLNWTVGKDSSKTLTVKGVLNTISGGADSGASVYTSVMAAGFEAQGATALDTTITAATGNQKVVYKTKPTFATPTIGTDSRLATGSKSIMKFKIKADGPEQVSWKQIQFQVSMTGATMSAADANPATTGNVTLKDVSTGSNLNIASAFSGTATTTGAQATITGGNTGYVSLLLNSEQTISAGAEKEYELSLTFADVSGTVGAASAQVKLWRTESTLVNATTVSDVRTSLGTATDSAPSFVWSDNSATSHSETTTDWANSVLVKVLPSTSVTISN